MSLSIKCWRKQKLEGKKPWSTYGFFFSLSLNSPSNCSIKRGTKPVVSSAMLKYFFTSVLKSGNIDCATTFRGKWIRCCCSCWSLNSLVASSSDSEVNSLLIGCILEGEIISVALEALDVPVSIVIRHTLPSNGLILVESPIARRSS